MCVDEDETLSNNAIEIENLGKRYRIASRRSDNSTLAATLVNAFKQPARRIGNLLSGNTTGAADLDQDFWALRHINFTVEHGETVGVIGQNGAGKSTLLKLLSRITLPTEGEARINGRVGSLLEVGTGFNFEFTGRENIYLNGSILGMRTDEINAKFDEIVEFAGVADFIDTPVKHYSSGMTVRLAFAVAAHLEPEILLVDEVLAVGDYAFQKKSLGKMQDVTRSGRTVLFVSHQLDMVRAICDRVVLLKDGQVSMIGPVNEIVDTYVEQYASQVSEDAIFEIEEDPELDFQFLSGKILNQHGDLCSQFDMFDSIQIEYEYIIKEPTIGMNIATAIMKNGEAIFLTWDTDKEPALLDHREPGRYCTRVTLPTPLLKEGIYEVQSTIGFVMGRGLGNQRISDLSFRVFLHSESGTNVSYAGRRRGKIAAKLDWLTTKSG